MGIPFVDPIQEIITQEVFGCLKKPCLILIHFKKNFINLEGKKKELEKQRGNVEEKVKGAELHGDIIKDEVSEWMNDMYIMIKEVDDLIQAKTARESIMCFRFSFPSYISRYRLSKRAEEKIVDVKKMISDGDFTAVSYPAPPPPELHLPPTTTEYEVFDSRLLVLNEIKAALKENNIVGIHGAGGVGKTTMAAEIAKQLQSEGYFHEYVMAVVSQDPDVKRIQGKLASSLKDFELDEKENEEQRARKLWNRLRNGKSNLVILDNLWGKINLKKIGIPVAGGNKDCKLLLTSRQPQEVWKDKTWDSKLHVKLVLVNQLYPREAWALFKNHAGDSIDGPYSKLRSVASQVCEKCGGLPVAIRAVGEALRDKELFVWQDALNKLENATIDKIVGVDEEFFPCLKLSYDLLKLEEARKCFLLCCLFPADTEIPIEDLVIHCKAAGLVGGKTMEDTRYSVYTLIKHLKDCCLLLDVADQENSVKVHDVFRDVGIFVSKNADETLQLMHGFWNIQGRAYIATWLQKSHFDDDHDDFVCPDIGTLVLQWNDSSVEDDHAHVLRAKKFVSTTIGSLKVLVLYGVSVSSLFPSPSECLMKLRMLCLDTWKENDKNILTHLGKSLEVLRLSGHDREIVELPVEIGLLTKLVVLDLERLWGLQKIQYGLFSKLTRLEELHLPPIFFGWENGSVVELNCLKKLTSLRICLPNCDLPWANDSSLEKLNRFHISVGRTVAFFSKEFTKVLEFEGVPTTNKLYGLVGRAEKLFFKSVHSLSAVMHVRVHGFPCLKALEIRRCNDLKYLFSAPCARALRQQLQRLQVRRCESLVSIVGGIEEDQEDIICFDGLKQLELRNVPNLVGFYSRGGTENCSAANGETSVLFSDKVSFPVVEDLIIAGVPKIEKIWDDKNFPNLKRLKIADCEKIESIVSNQEKKGMEGTSGDIVIFRHLTSVRLVNLINVRGFYTMRSLPKEESFFNHQIEYPALKDCWFFEIPRATTDVFKMKVLPQLVGQKTKEMCQQENIFQGVLLPNLSYLGLYDENIEMPKKTSFTPAEHGITAEINRKKHRNCDKRLFQPLFNAILGFGCE